MADGENRGPVVLTVTVVVLVLATIFVALRMSSRIFIVKKATLDDYIMLLAWAISLGLSVAICYGTSVGLGRHQDDIPPEWSTGLKKAEYVFSVLYNPSLMATKTSLLLFYLKLSTTEHIFRWATYFTLALTNLAGFALTMLNVFQCRPVAAVFETPIPTNAHCESIVTLYLSSAPVNIITDLAILFLPMPILTSMRLPRKQKIILIVTFGVGFFVAVIDVIRIAYLQDAATARLAALQSGNADASGTGQRNDTDVSWYASLSYMWSAVEVNVGIMCACVPGLKPLVSRFLPTMLRDINRNISNSRGSRTSGRVDSLDLHTKPGIGSIDEMVQSKQVVTTAGSASSTSRHSHHSNTGGQPMDLIDFLTTPDMTELPHQLRQTQTRDTNRSPQPVRFFDFVEVKQRKSMIDLTLRESLVPNIMVTVLFLIWGIAYGFLDTLNLQFQTAAHMTTAMTVGNHSAYFGAYAVGSLTFGRLVLKHWGFKACYIVGLCVYACGVLVFWPSAVLTSFPAFLVSNFLVGLGLSTLEIAANPFVALCGPQQYMEIRLNLSQGVQAIGSVVSPLLAQRVLFKSTASATSLIDVQWTYLGIALFSVALAVIYFYVPLPEASDAELERAQAQRADYANVASFQGVRIIWISLGLGVLSQFCYVGAQESISTSFSYYVKQAFHSPIDTNTWSAVGHSCFAAGRFLAAGLNTFIKARHLLLFFYCGAIALAAIAMHYSGATPQTAIMLLYFFEGPIFSIIFATSLRGLGRHTKDGSAVLAAAISGGAAWPPIIYAVARGGHKRYQYAYCVVVAAFAIGLLFPIWLNAQPMARKLADPLREEDDLNNLHNLHAPPLSSNMSSAVRKEQGAQGLRHEGKHFLKNFKKRWRRDSEQGVEHLEQAPPTSSVPLQLP